MTPEPANPRSRFGKQADLRFRFGDRELTAPPGSTIASALLANQIVSWRTTRRDNAPRGLFCGIGNCHDCLVDVNDRQAVRACQHPLHPGDHVRPGSVATPAVAAPAVAAPVGTHPAHFDPPRPTPSRASANPVDVTTMASGRGGCDNHGVTGEVFGAAREVRVVGEVVVVGAGPGGMAAALAAADAGCRVILIDGAARVGGQIYRQSTSALDDGGGLPDRFRRVLAHPLITTLTGTTVWHAQRNTDAAPAVPGPDVSTTQPNPRVRGTGGGWGVNSAIGPPGDGEGGGAFVLRCTGTTGVGPAGMAVVTARAVVLATGAAELVLPFPGWTLPGVITAGAAQALLKAQPQAPAARLLPGPRVLVAGTGPLLLRAAADLVNRGATVVAVCDTARPASMLSSVPAALRHPGKLAEGAGYGAKLARARPRVRMLSGWTVTGCYGDGRVQQVRVASVDLPASPGGRPRRSPGRSRMFAIDVVAVSHGLVPALDLSRALGCQDEQLADFPAAVVVVDREQATSADGVFACGELTGVGGTAKAEPEGVLAGLAAARHLGRLDETAFRRKARGAIARVRSARHFARLLATLYPLPRDWPDRLQPGTLVCRCEEVTLADLRRAIDAGSADLRTIKGMTRCGMGYCQGRICGPLAQYAAARLTARPLSDLGDLHTRHITTPVTLSTLAACNDAG